MQTPILVRRRGTTRLGTLLCLVPLVAASPARAGPDPLVELLEKDRCPVADRLQRLTETGDPAQDHDRFIVVAMPAPRRGYVQCLFHDNETRVLCEAASGFTEAKPGEPRTVRLAPAKIAALGRLGVSTDDRAGNFAGDRAVAAPPDSAPWPTSSSPRSPPATTRGSRIGWNSRRPSRRG